MDLLVESLQSSLEEQAAEVVARQDEEMEDADMLNEAAAILAAVEAERVQLQLRVEELERGAIVPRDGFLTEDVQRLQEANKMLEVPCTYIYVYSSYFFIYSRIVFLCSHHSKNLRTNGSKRFPILSLN